MFVCHCRAVTDREIDDAIAGGARDLDEIGRRCGAGITCGGCCPLLQELLENFACRQAARNQGHEHAGEQRRERAVAGLRA
jgi:bacterioferritin-associated ferredoxin